MVRFEVPNESVPWSAKFGNYEPVFFEAHHLEGAPWADPVLGTPGFSPSFNQVDGKINRKSHEGDYQVRFDRCENLRAVGTQRVNSVSCLFSFIFVFLYKLSSQKNSNSDRWSIRHGR